MEQLILVIHILAAAGLIGFILIQQGKGAEVGASFGSGASQTVFGSQGSKNFKTRATAILVTIFFITSLALGYLATKNAKPRDLDELINKVQPATTQPAEKADKQRPSTSDTSIPSSDLMNKMESSQQPITTDKPAAGNKARDNDIPETRN